jgi:hypothetical protein
MTAPTADTVASLLESAGTRVAALDALDAHAVPIERSMSLAAAPALGRLLAADAAEVGREQFDRIGVLLARLVAEATDDPASVYGAALGDGRMRAQWASPDSILARALRKPAGELTLADAHSCSCWNAHFSPAHIRGLTAPCVSAGLTLPDYFGQLVSEHPILPS